MPKKWPILVLADAISMTTGPLFSCELPLTNYGPNDFTDAFPPENKNKFYFKFFQSFSKNKFAVQEMGQFCLVYGCHRRKTRENVSSHCVIKFISTKNAKVLDTGGKFVINIKLQNMHVLLCLILKMFFP